MDSITLKLARPLLGTVVQVTMDRPLGTLHPKHGFIYEENYGYIEGIVAPDGEALDAYFLGASEALQNARGMCVAIIHRLTDDDDKLVVVPEGTSISDEEIRTRTNFQEKWFDSEIICI
jgi:inorganic pyrophosphatase